jgi:hypothetical protein
VRARANLAAFAVLFEPVRDPADDAADAEQ